MESKRRPINRPAPTHIPPPRVFPGHTRRPGFMEPGLGRGHHVNFLRYHYHPMPQAVTSPHSYEIQEAIQREIEKSRIREEIIMSEIVNRRILESEVRRELMMGRALSLGGDVFSLGLPGRLPALGATSEERSSRSIDERIAFPHSGRERLNDRHGSGWYDTIPFQRGAIDLRVSEVKSVSEGGKEKEKTILLAKPVEIVSAPKRKAVNECPSDDISRKKAREEWSCALCQVSATNEKGFNAHLKGKKHKSKEAGLRAQSALKNHSNGTLSKKAPKSAGVEGTVDFGTVDGQRLTSESLLDDKTEETGSEMDGQRLLQNNINVGDRLKKNHLTTVQTAQKSNRLKKGKFKLWCEICQAGASSQKVMNSHINGKKHLFRIKKSKGTGRSDRSDKPNDEATVS